MVQLRVGLRCSLKHRTNDLLADGSGVVGVLEEELACRVLLKRASRRFRGRGEWGGRSSAGTRAESANKASARAAERATRWPTLMTAPCVRECSCLYSERVSECSRLFSERSSCILLRSSARLATSVACSGFCGGVVRRRPSTCRAWCLSSASCTRGATEARSAADAAATATIAPTTPPARVETSVEQEGETAETSVGKATSKSRTRSIEPRGWAGLRAGRVF